LASVGRTGAAASSAVVADLWVWVSQAIKLAAIAMVNVNRINFYISRYFAVPFYCELWLIS
jgi:hypothetical protein